MSAPRPLESKYLDPVESALSKAASAYRRNPFELRLQILEAAASRFGGFDLDAYHRTFGFEPLLSASKLLELAEPVADAIEQSPIHPGLALSALAREVLTEQDRKKTGAYHTDFRLANRLAELAAPKLTHESRVIDPACGAGILLAALTIAVCGMDRQKISVWLSQGVCAADLSDNSLRAALLSLASFTDDLAALKAMRARWFCGDSLMADTGIWTAMAPEGFDAVIGNPPWEKVKLTRHEFMKSSGKGTHYGDNVSNLDKKRFDQKRNRIAEYSRKLLERYPDLGAGEPDLYIAFTSLFFNLCKNEGVVAALLPGGLIRSKGTQSVRHKIFEAYHIVSLSIIDNKAKFFAIDTRFKFLAVALIKTDCKSTRRKPLTLLHERGTPLGVEVYGKANIGRKTLSTIRPDMSLPEVRSDAEWMLFSKICKNGQDWSDSESEWYPRFCREVDMTKERPKFLNAPASKGMPLIEGRMVHSHRLGVKGHVSGTGRRAVWEAFPIGASVISPQFWIKPSDIPKGNRDRTKATRIGFCDIAGQTNERSMTASLIPAGVACGNKVPTIIFPNDPSEDRMLVWAAVTNSFVFDWALRRVITTTVNYFLLQSVPLPKLTPNGLPWRRLANAAKELTTLDAAGASPENVARMAELRSEIDAEVAVAYGLGVKDMELVFQDFPLLDRGQPSLPSESQSTITRDTVIAAVAKRSNSKQKAWLQRTQEACRQGACAYVPSELARKKTVTTKEVKCHE